MRLLVRCDASPAIGLGHLARCFALTERLAPLVGAAPVFLVGPDPLASAFLAARGAEYELVDGTGYAVGELLDHAHGPTLVVSDTHELGESDLEAIDRAGLAHLVIDDFARLSRWPCQLVVNPNLGAQETRYAGARAVLVGPEFALLRSEISDAAGRRRPAATPRVLVCLGGGQWPHAAQALLAELGALADDGVDVVAATESAVPAGVAAVSPATLADELASASIAVLSAGVLKYEAAACGVPAVLLAVVEHQDEVAPAFAATGAGLYLGPLAEAEPGAVVDAVRRLLGDEAKRERMTRAGRALVDGRGADRVAACFVEGLG